MNSKGRRYNTTFKIKAVELIKFRENIGTVASELISATKPYSVGARLMIMANLKKVH